MWAAVMWDDAKQMNALAATLALVALAGIVVTAAILAMRQPVFAIREVTIATPLSRVNGAHLEAVIRAELTGTIFTLDLAQASAALSRVPWVRAVALRRQWPHRLEVEVEEHEPLARFNEGRFVNAHGEVFEAASRDDLPRFEGPEARAPDMTGRYRAWSQALQPLSLRLSEVRLSPRGGWRVLVSDGPSALWLELGRDDPDARLARFVAAYPQTVGTLHRAGTRIDVVDLRYRNGFAVRVPGFRDTTGKPKA
jgi:cell division protein FtsQ